MAASSIEAPFILPLPRPAFQRKQPLVIIKKGLRSGVFLPQVATETGWDLETFMGQLCSQKAGLSWDCWKKKGVEIYIFTAQVFEEE